MQEGDEKELPTRDPQEQAALDAIAAEEKAVKDAAQEEADQIQRDERHRLGVS